MIGQRSAAEKASLQPIEPQSARTSNPHRPKIESWLGCYPNKIVTLEDYLDAMHGQYHCLPKYLKHFINFERVHTAQAAEPQVESYPQEHNLFASPLIAKVYTGALKAVTVERSTQSKKLFRARPVATTCAVQLTLLSQHDPKCLDAEYVAIVDKGTPQELIVPSLDPESLHHFLEVSTGLIRDLLAVTLT